MLPPHFGSSKEATGALWHTPPTSPGPLVGPQGPQESRGSAGGLLRLVAAYSTRFLMS
jgi:hypothetical protein